MQIYKTKKMIVDVTKYDGYYIKVTELNGSKTVINDTPSKETEKLELMKEYKPDFLIEVFNTDDSFPFGGYYQIGEYIYKIYDFSDSNYWNETDENIQSEFHLNEDDKIIACSIEVKYGEIVVSKLETNEISLQSLLSLPYLSINHINLFDIIGTIWLENGGWIEITNPDPSTDEWYGDKQIYSNRYPKKAIVAPICPQIPTNLK